MMQGRMQTHRVPEWIQRFREMLWRWSLWALIYVLGLIATHTWYKLGHCSSVAWTPYQGSSLNPQLAIWRTRLSGPFLYLAPRNGGLRWRKTIDCTGMFAQRNKFMTYLCKSCHFENPENIRHKMKRNILFRYSGNFSNIDQWYARTCPIIDIWPTNPSDRTTFETPANHLTNKSILIARTVNSGVTSLCFWQKWGKWSKSCPSNMHSD